LEESQKKQRSDALEKIVNSTHDFKVLVAGAGTGKTYAFKKVLENQSTSPEDSLALTFINNLVGDMKKDLGHLTEARTFHSYCKKLLHKKPALGIRSNFVFYPQLKLIVSSDSKLQKFDKKAKPETFDRSIQTLSEDKYLNFFIESANYYNAVGFDDSVYRILKYFETNKDSIPKLKQIVVDEYQDFCALEVSFLDFLSTKSPMLIAGDDDQAVYLFRQADPKHIRDKWTKHASAQFNLPFCTRCTSVIVEATNAFIRKAETGGFLCSRITKRYECYLDEGGKGADSANYPLIKAVTCTVNNKRAPYIAKYVESEIKKINTSEIKDSIGRYPIVLIIGPKHYLNQVYDYIKERFADFKIEFPEKNEFEVTILDGYRILLRDISSNLGWRIILSDQPKLLRKIIGKAKSQNVALKDLIAESVKDEIEQRVKLLQGLVDGDSAIRESEVKSLETFFGLPSEELKSYVLYKDDEDGAEVELNAQKPVIKLTSFNGSKGLSGAHVFVIGLEEASIPKNKGKPTDTEICQFVIALTRTRLQCHLISTSLVMGFRNWKNRSEFVDWIPSRLLSSVRVDKNFFNSTGGAP